MSAAFDFDFKIIEGDLSSWSWP